jgi:hypothetical protein
MTNREPDPTRETFCPKCTRLVEVPEELLEVPFQCGACQHPLPILTEAPSLPTVQFWLWFRGAFVKACLGFALFAALLWYLIAPRWRTVEPEDGMYRCDFPSVTQVEETSTLDLPFGKVTVKTVGCTFRRREESYLVRYLDVPPERQLGPRLLDDGCTFSLTQFKEAKAIERKELIQDGLPCVEQRASFAGNGYLVVRTFLARNRLFMLLAINATQGKEPSQTQRFLDSFRVTGISIRPIEREANGKPKHAPSATDVNGCILHFPFEENAGNTLVEAKSGAALGEAFLGVQRCEGVRGNALRFDPKIRVLGGGKELVNPHGKLPGLEGKLPFAAKSEFSISLWFLSRQEEGVLLSHRTSSNSAEMVDLFLGWGGRPTVRVRSASAREAVEFRGEQSLADGWWHHLLLTRDSRGVLTLFVDGEAEAQGKAIMPGALNCDWIGVGAELYNAVRGSTGSDAVYFNGDIDELAYFNRSLSVQEAQHLAGRVQPEAKRRSFWW